VGRPQSVHTARPKLPLQLPRPYSNSIECPQCKARLEVAPGSADDLNPVRTLLRRAIAWRPLEWFWGRLGRGPCRRCTRFLAFGRRLATCPHVLRRICVTRPALPSTEPAHAADTHGGGWASLGSEGPDRRRALTTEATEFTEGPTAGKTGADIFRLSVGDEVALSIPCICNRYRPLVLILPPQTYY